MSRPASLFVSLLPEWVGGGKVPESLDVRRVALRKRDLKDPWADKVMGQLKRAIKELLNASVKYATNHIVSHVPSYWMRHTWYRRVLGWHLGAKAGIFMGQHIQMAGVRASGRRVSIGADTLIHEGCLLSTRGGLVIGEHVNISAHASLLSSSHEIDDPDFAIRYRPIVIDDYVWIGPRTMILAGVTVGKGAVVLAGAVVADDVAPYAIVGGVPATVVGQRALRDPSYTLDYRPLLE